MSLYEFNATLKHYVKIKTGKSSPMTAAEYDEGVEKLRGLGLKDVRI